MREPAILEKILTADEYLEAELASEVKHEFDNGKLVAMAGGEIEHNLIQGEIYSLLKNFIQASRPPFLALNSETKVWFPKLNKFVYPDVSVLSKPPQFYVTPTGKVRRDAVLNPVLVVEVLSDDTRNYDKGEKFERYCTLPSFREYLLVEPLKTWAETIYIGDENAEPPTRTFTDSADTIRLHSLDCEIKLRDIYRVLEDLT